MSKIIKNYEIVNDEQLEKDKKMVKINIEIPEKTYAIIINYLYEDKKTGVTLSNKSIGTTELQEIIKNSKKEVD